MQIIFIISTFIQITAAILAIMYIKKTPHIGWLFIALVLLLIGLSKVLNSMGFVLPPFLVEIAGSIIILCGVFVVHKIFRQFNKNITQLESLVDIDHVMLSSLSHRGTLNAIVDKLNSTLAIDAAAVLTINKDNNGPKYNIFASSNLSKKFKEYIQSSSNGYVSSVIDNRKPLIISKITDDESDEFLKTLKAGGVVSYMGAPIIIKGGVPIGVLTLYSKRPRGYSKREIEFINVISSQIAKALDRTQLTERIQEMSVESVRTLVEAIEIRDPYTRGHSVQVADLCFMIGSAMGFTERELTMMEFAGLLHDVGKIAVPEMILQKRGKLTFKEWDILRKHPLHSVKIIEPVLNLKPIQNWILHHHERWDGNGYPLGRQAGDIPLQSRILAVCDTYSAMTGDRPYRKGATIKETKNEIERVAGSQLDPMIVDVFLNLDLSESNKKITKRIQKFRRDVDSISKALNIPSQRKMEHQLRFL